MRRLTGFVKDYYKVLGVPATATYEEIKRAWRILAKRYHPDVSEEPDAEDKFKELQQAYSTLKDPVERSEYNRVREQAAAKPNFEPDRAAYRYWQSPTPARRSFVRKALHGLIVLFWMLTGLFARVGRMIILALLTTALAVFQWVFPFLVTPLIVAGLILEGNPFHLATWSAHPQLTFLCFGFPILAVIVAVVAYHLTEWVAQKEPLFPCLQNKINALRYRTLCY
jgi:hypothetical protein